MLNKEEKKARNRIDNQLGNVYIPKLVFSILFGASILVLVQSFFSEFNFATMVLFGINLSLLPTLFFLKNKSYDVSKHFMIFITSLIIIFNIYFYGIMAGGLYLMVPLIIAEILFWRSKRNIYLIYHAIIFVLVLLYVWLESANNLSVDFNQNQLSILNLLALFLSLIISIYISYTIINRHDKIEERYFDKKAVSDSIFKTIIDHYLIIDKAGFIKEFKSNNSSTSPFIDSTIYDILNEKEKEKLLAIVKKYSRSESFHQRIKININQNIGEYSVYKQDDETYMLVLYRDAEYLSEIEGYANLKQEYQIIINSDTRGIIIFDYDLNTQVFNDKAQILCGTICHKNEYPNIAKLFKRFDSIKFEHILLETKKGNIVYKEVKVEDSMLPTMFLAIEFVPIKNGNNIQDKIIATITDITLNKKLEIDTKHAKNEAEKLSAIIDQTEISIAIINATGDIVYSNPAFKQKHWNKSSPEKLNNLFELLPQDSAAINDINFIKTCISIGNGCQVQVPVRTTKNYSYVATFIMQPLQAITNERHYSVILQDMSMQIERENQLKRAKEYAEKASKMKTNFLSNISHEIRTPLNAIIGLTDLMITEHQNDAIASNLSLIKSSSSNLLAVMNTLLDYSRIETGKIVIDRSEFDLKPLLDDIVRLFKQTADSKGIQLFIKFDSRIPNTLIGDAYRISQVISNLLSNALKFTDEGGTVTLAVSTFETQDKSIKIKVEVIDTGIGIKEEDKNDIFLSFSKIQANTYSNSGTGVGLAMIKSLLDLMGSTIQLDSKYGSGSNFWFVLALGLKENGNSKELATNENKSAPSFENLNVLLVEDNVVNQFVALQLLKKWNIKAKTALNGSIAIEVLLKESFDLVLMDIQMPVMNGLECTEKIRKGELGEKLKSIPIVALSADVFPETREKASQLGFNFFLNKPIKHDELLSVINSFSVKKKDDFKKTNSATTNKPNIAQTMLNIDFIKENISDEPEFIKEVLEVFIATNQADYEILVANFQEKDATSIKKAAHKLKSSFKSLGVTSTGAKLEQIERLALAGTLEGIDTLLQEVESDILTIKEEVLNYL